MSLSLLNSFINLFRTKKSAPTERNRFTEVTTVPTNPFPPVLGMFEDETTYTNLWTMLRDIEDHTRMFGDTIINADNPNFPPRMGFCSLPQIGDTRPGRVWSILLGDLKHCLDEAEKFDEYRAAGDPLPMCLKSKAIRQSLKTIGGRLALARSFVGQQFGDVRAPNAIES